MGDLVVALDFDGVMYPLIDAFRFHRQRLGLVPPVPAFVDRYEFWLPMGLTPEEFAVELASFAEAGGYRLAEPYPEALAGVAALFDAGCDLLGVTSRPLTTGTHHSTYAWVGDWGLPLRSVLIGPTAKLEAEYDILVDDNPDELEALYTLGDAFGLLLDRPWNQGACWPRVSWEELPSLAAAAIEAIAGCSELDRRDALGDFLQDVLPT